MVAYKMLLGPFWYVALLNWRPNDILTPAELFKHEFLQTRQYPYGGCLNRSASYLVGTNNHLVEVHIENIGTCDRLNSNQERHMCVVSAVRTGPDPCHVMFLKKCIRKLSGDKSNS